MGYTDAMWAVTSSGWAAHTGAMWDLTEFMGAVTRAMCAVIGSMRAFTSAQETTPAIFYHFNVFPDFLSRTRNFRL